MDYTIHIPIAQPVTGYIGSKEMKQGNILDDNSLYDTYIDTLWTIQRCHLDCLPLPCDPNQDNQIEVGWMDGWRDVSRLIESPHNTGEHTNYISEKAQHSMFHLPTRKMLPVGNNHLTL